MYVFKGIDSYSYNVCKSRAEEHEPIIYYATELNYINYHLFIYIINLIKREKKWDFSNSFWTSMSHL